VVTSDLNIWEDPDAAAAVRLVAGGNETVPTVTVGAVVMVNPSVTKVLAEIERQSPGRLSAAASHFDGASGPTGSGLGMLQWTVLVVLVLMSVVAEAYGQSALSWVIDGLTVAIYLALKMLRRSLGTRTR
jgi:mycoredoxin